MDEKSRGTNMLSIESMTDETENEVNDDESSNDTFENYIARA